MVNAGQFTGTRSWRRIESDVRLAVAAVQWPPGSGTFTIYPESGKQRGRGNGVRPIEEGFVTKLSERGWTLERRQGSDENVGEDDVARSLRPGAFDAWLELQDERRRPFVIEWETGNVSSSHRALNKIALGLLQKRLSGGLLVVPSRELYRYLTDRVGNYRELEPYFPIWSSVSTDRGYLGVIEVEHDATSLKVPRITKGTDGRALI